MLVSAAVSASAGTLATPSSSLCWYYSRKVCADCAVVAYPRIPSASRSTTSCESETAAVARSTICRPSTAPAISARADLRLQAENPTSYGLAGVGMDDVDPVSMAYEFWRHASDNHPDLAQRVASLPNIVYSTKHTTDAAPDTGVLVHTQTVAGADAFAFVEPNGQAGRVTPQEALRLAECDPSTPSVQRLDDHHDLTAAALGGPLRTPVGRATGALQGVRGKVWRRLHEHMDNLTDNLLFTRSDLEAAHDAINERPLYESAT